ncbi:uncharacterized protein LOC119720859 [Patiria miniata]|uniref:Uncharacterized protein n=1 Tax=Patiria miniata TaxID=46514 RepID=A0A913Z494_PATMI|nr:uncharacterized protein LOC119720859 [Patiria miniata]
MLGVKRTDRILKSVILNIVKAKPLINEVHRKQSGPVITQPAAIDLRIVDGRYPNEGRVEVRLPGHETWGSYCSVGAILNSSFLHAPGRVLCRQLGYPALYAISNTAQFGTATGPIWLQGIDCGSVVQPLEECTLEQWTPRYDGCDHRHDVGIKCFTGDIRLVGGRAENDGIVMLHLGGNELVPLVYDGVAMPFKDLDFVSDFICRHLGFPYAVGRTKKEVHDASQPIICEYHFSTLERSYQCKEFFECIDERMRMCSGEEKRSKSLLGVVCAREHEVLPPTATPEFRLTPPDSRWNGSRHVGFLEGRYNSSDWKTVCFHFLPLCTFSGINTEFNQVCRDRGYARAANRLYIPYLESGYNSTGDDLILRRAIFKKRWMYGQNSCRDHNYSLVFIECDQGVTIYGLTVYPCPKQSCLGRCGSPATETQCGCDVLCTLCNDCCHDYSTRCHLQQQNVTDEFLLVASLHDFLSCVIVDDERAVLVQGCPTDWPDDEVELRQNNSMSEQVKYGGFFHDVYCVICYYNESRVITTKLSWHENTIHETDNDFSSYSSSSSEYEAENAESYDLGIDNCSVHNVSLEIQTGCRAYSAMVVASNGRVYKNPHCAFCNGVNFSGWDSDCSPFSARCTLLKPVGLLLGRQDFVWVHENSTYFVLLSDVHCFNKQYVIRVKSSVNLHAAEVMAMNQSQTSGMMQCYLIVLSQQNVQSTWPFYVAFIEGKRVSLWEDDTSEVTTWDFGNVTDFEALLDDSVLPYHDEGSSNKWVVRCGVAQVEFDEICGLVDDHIEPCEVSLYITDEEMLKAFNFSGIQVVYVGGGLLVEAKWVSYTRSYQYHPKVQNTSAKSTTVKVCGKPFLNEECRTPVIQKTKLMSSGGQSVVQYQRKLFLEDRVVYLPDDRILICSSIFTTVDPLSVVSYVSYSVSTVALVATFTTYCVFPALRNVPGRAIMGLTAALSTAQLLALILVVTRITDPAVFCVIVAALLHHLWLSTFAWMNVLSFDLLKTFSAKQTVRRNKRIFLVYSAYGWGIPLLIVATCLAIHFIWGQQLDFQYGAGPGEDTCWLSGQYAIVGAFVAPIACSLVANVVMFGWTVRNVHASVVAGAMVRADKSKTKELVRELQIYFKISAVMGFTWVFGCLANRINHVVLWYLFVILNSLQGVFIFLSFGWNRRIRALWREKLAAKQPRGASDANKSKTQTTPVVSKQSSSNI